MNRYSLKLLSPLLFVFSSLSFFRFLLTKKNSDLEFRVFRKTFAGTNGLFNDFCSALLLRFSRKKIEMTELTNNHMIDEKEKSGFISAMKSDGYYVFKKQCPSNLVNEIEQGINKIRPYKLDYVTGSLVQDDSFPELIDSPRYNYDLNDLAEVDLIRKLAVDHTMIDFAKEYLGSDPICDLLASWWSFPNSDEASRNSAAQMFHWDMDRLKFIKFFVYLNDVGESNGPHCYVKSSHKSLPFKFHRDGRFEDQAVKDSFGKGSIKKVTGAKGTIIAVDTRGLHKGVPLKEGKRLILQFEYSNSMYGKNYNRNSKATGRNSSENYIIQGLRKG